MVYFEIKKDDMALVAGTALLIAVLAFGCGVDHQLNIKDQATIADRKRIYCSTPGHIKTYCYDTATTH